MGSFDHARVGWPSKGDRTDHIIVGQDRHQTMRHFKRLVGRTADRIVGRLLPTWWRADLFLREIGQPRIRRTEVRPICMRRAFSDLLTAA
jgi:hypothetical protein